MDAIREARAPDDVPSAPLPAALPLLSASPRRPSRSWIAGVLRLSLVTVSVALGLTAVAVGLIPPASGPSTARPLRLHHLASARKSPGPSPVANQIPAPPPPLLWERILADRPGATARRDSSIPASWHSPLEPQNGLTLWEQIWVSEDTDPLGFLFGSAIQLSAPQIAATPGPLYNRFP
jgi:hypothetical protein